MVVETDLEEGRDAESAFSDAAWFAFQNVYADLPERFRLSECLDRFPPDEIAVRHLRFCGSGNGLEAGPTIPARKMLASNSRLMGFTAMT